MVKVHQYSIRSVTDVDRFACCRDVTYSAVTRLRRETYPHVKPRQGSSFYALALLCVIH